MLDPKEITSWQDKANALVQRYNRSQIEDEINLLQTASLEIDFWNGPQAKEKMQKMGTLQNSLENLNSLSELLDELETSQFLLFEEGENHNYQEQMEITALKLKNLVKKLELEQYLKGKYDAGGAIFSVHSGQGGTEAMDWSSMLARAYTRFFERQGFKYKLISESRGEEAGIKAISYEVQGKFAYGLLKHESGTHRLVRLSPFNADSLRQTSFALVDILPLIEENDKNIILNENDLEWHFTRAGGAGGQNVNKVNTAVELTYTPLNLVVRCREERSQEQNKQRALQILRAKIALIQEQAQANELSLLKGENVQASWGTQIRNYVLHPYQLVKDTRTGVETSDTAGVLDGEFLPFINAALAQLSV